MPVYRAHHPAFFWIWNMATIKRLTERDWASIRAKREAGSKTFRELGKEYGVSFALIARRSKKEGWGDGSNMEEMIQKKTQQKVIGVNSYSPKKIAEAVDAEADKRAEVLTRHRKEWLQVTVLRQEALEHRKINEKKAFELLKVAKITAEITAIQQAGESRAYGLAGPPIDVKSMTDEQLEYVIKTGKMPK